MTKGQDVCDRAVQVHPPGDALSLLSFLFVERPYSIDLVSGVEHCRSVLTSTRARFPNFGNRRSVRKSTLATPAMMHR